MEDYRCNSCKISFSTRSALSEHLDAKHLNDSNECFLCNKKISSKANLSKHLKEVDTYQGCQMVRFNIFLSLDCAGLEGGELNPRKGRDQIL